MITLLIISGVLAALVTLYILVGRDWLKDQWWTGKFFSWIEPVEIALWKKSETILWARLLMLAGILPQILEQAEKLNIPAMQDILPMEFRGWWTLSFTVIGIVSELLRRNTTRPLALVAVPETAPPQVLEAVKAADEVKEEAVKVVEIAAIEKK